MNYKFRHHEVTAKGGLVCAPYYGMDKVNVLMKIVIRAMHLSHNGYKGTGLRKDVDTCAFELRLKAY